MKKSKPALLGTLLNISLYSAAILPHANGQILLRDEFTASGQSNDVNFEINTSARQTGTLAGTTYTQGFGDYSTGGSTADTGVGPDSDFRTQINDSLNGKLWLIPQGGSNVANVSPNHNFIENPGVGGYMSISFDLNPNTGPGGPDTWGAIIIGASDNALFGSSGTGARGRMVNNSAPHFGILFKDTGSYETFGGGTNGSFPPDHTGPNAVDSHHYEIRITGIDDGNPWDGVGNALVEMFRDNSETPFLSFTRPGGYVDNYITLQGYSNNLLNHEFDNFQVSVVGTTPPEPIELALLNHSFDFTADELTLTWTSMPGQNYKVRTSGNLIDWEDFETGIAGQPNQTSKTISFTQGDKAFFRVETEQPNP